MGGERRRREQVRTDKLGAAGGARDSRKEGTEGLSATDTLPHRQPDNQDTPHTDGPEGGFAVLHPAAQDGLQRRLRRLRRRTGRRLRRHTLAQQRKLGELLDTGIRERLHLHLRRGCRPQRHSAPQPHHGERPLAVGTPLGAGNRRARNGVAARNARGV